MCCLCFPDFDVNSFLSVFSGIFTIVITILYFTKPNIRIIEVYKRGNQLYVKIQNGNCLFKIVDITCEFILSETENFDTANTLKLIKDRTLRLSNGDLDNYIFKSNKDKKSQSKRYLRVILLAPNILGIKKVKVATFKLIEIADHCNQTCPKNINGVLGKVTN